MGRNCGGLAGLARLTLGLSRISCRATGAGRDNSSDCSTLGLPRLFLLSLLLLLSLAEIIVSLLFIDPQPLSVPVDPAVQALGFLASLLLSIAGRSRGQVGDGEV